MMWVLLCLLLCGIGLVEAEVKVTEIVPILQEISLHWDHPFGMYFDKRDRTLSISTFLNYTTYKWPALKEDLLHQLTHFQHNTVKHKHTYAFILIYHATCWDKLLQQIASIHAMAWSQPIQLFAVNAPPDHLDHLAMLSHVTTHRLAIPPGEAFTFTDLQNAIKLVHYVFPAVIYLSPELWLASDQLCRMDQTAWPFISRENTLRDEHDLNDARFQIITTKPMDVNGQITLYGSPLACILHHMLPLPKAIPIDRSKPNVCLAISTFSRNKVEPASFSLNRIVVASLMRVLTEATYSAANIHLYLGTQVGDAWDDPEWRQSVLETIKATCQDRLSVHLYRYPLVGALVDITVKYNMLIMQAYMDGCDYIYQYSDDAEFMPSSMDWPLKMMADFEQRRGFGTWGLRDENNAATMTLGASTRLHIELQGWFWPPILKNWYSDDYIQKVYGPSFSTPRHDLTLRNTQAYGQRYDSCIHDLELKLVLILSRARALLWSVSEWPEQVPYFIDLFHQSVVEFKTQYPHAPATRSSCPGHLAIRTIHMHDPNKLFNDLLIHTQHLFDPARPIQLFHHVFPHFSHNETELHDYNCF